MSVDDLHTQPHSSLAAPLVAMIVEAGFAAVNHGMRAEAQHILAALPDWIDNPQQLARCEIIMLVGLGRPKAAEERLAILPPEEAARFRGIVLQCAAVVEAPLSVPPKSTRKEIR